MSPTELVPAIRMLPRADKLRLMQFLYVKLILRNLMIYERLYKTL